MQMAILLVRSPSEASPRLKVLPWACKNLCY